jgi:glucose-6-phosphate isomerase
MTTTTTTLPSRRTKADSLGRRRPKLDDGTNNDNNEITKRLQRVKAQQQQQQHAITDPQALADYYLQHENIPRVILQADLLGKSSISQINNILPVSKNFLSDAYGHVMRILPKQSQQLVSTTIEWKRLVKHANEIMLKSNNVNGNNEGSSTHLRDMLQDVDRCQSMYIQYDGIYFDYTRQRVTAETMDLLFDLASKQKLVTQIQNMFTGCKINYTEHRAVLHTALRAPKTEIGTVIVDGVDCIAEVHDVLHQIRQFTTAFRSGVRTGYTGKRMRNIISVGIGGSYLGPEFLHEVLKTEAEGIHSSLGYDLRFLANVDPVDVERTCADLDPEETLIIVVSKTFTTAETMLNARTMRQWLWDFMGDDPNVVRKHVVACSSVSATHKVQEFGIDTDTGFFRFWDWVGGRYSVCGAAGAVPISLMYGYELFEKFLAGARSMDEHFLTAPMRQNIPIIMGLLGCWNTSFMGYSSRALIPYAQALLRLPAHIQQLDMEVSVGFSFF